MATRVVEPDPSVADPEEAAGTVAPPAVADRGPRELTPEPPAVPTPLLAGGDTGVASSGRADRGSMMREPVTCTVLPQAETRAPTRRRPTERRRAFMRGPFA